MPLTLSLIHISSGKEKEKPIREAVRKEGQEKFIIGITCGAVAHKVFKLRELDKHAPGYLAKVIVAAASGLLLNVFTDPFLGYFRNVYIFGQEYTIAKALTKITGGVTFVNSVASTVCVVLLYLALRPALERANLLPKAQKASEPKADK